MKPTINLSKLRYFPISRYWRRLKPLYQSKEAEKLWRYNMRDYQEIKASDHKFKYTHDPKRYESPSDYDGCDWRCDRRYPHPGYWNYVCHAACHWVVDMNLYVAMKAFPEIPWRIVSCNAKGKSHSTVWNGSVDDPVLFDTNYLALNVTAQQAWEIASRGRFFKPGKTLRPYVFNKGYFKTKTLP